MEVSKGGVLIYIDNSNIWINTREYSAKKLGLVQEIEQDPRTRIEIRTMLRLAAGDREVIRAVIYGSEPPPVFHFWNNLKCCTFCEIEPQVTKRSGFNNREKEVDQSINLDIGADVVIHREHAKNGGTVILFTGDGGMINAVRHAVKYNWNVEIWAYRHSLCKTYTNPDEPGFSEKVNVRYLDDCFEEIIYYTLEWKGTFPDERSFVITFRKPIPELRREELLKLYVETATALSGMPMSGRYIKHSSKTAETHLGIVCNVGDMILKEDARKRKSDPEAQAGPFPFKFKPDDWEALVKLMYEMFGDERASEALPRLTYKKDAQALIERANKAAVAPNKFDFNGEVYVKVENLIGSGSTSKGVSPELAKLNRDFRPFLRSFPAFRQAMGAEVFYNTVVAPGRDDEDNEGYYEVQSSRKHKKKFQKYSEPCKWGFRCRDGFRCTYSHSSREEELFKIQPDSKRRGAYKHVQCSKYAVGACDYRDEMSYMCQWRHGHYCLTCQRDEDGGGHAGDDPCPELRYLQLLQSRRSSVDDDCWRV